MKSIWQARFPNKIAFVVASSKKKALKKLRKRYGKKKVKKISWLVSVQ